MAKTREQAEVEVILNGQKANASIKEMEASLRVMRKQWSGLASDSKEFDDASKKIKEMSARLDQAKGSAQGMGQAFTQLKGILPVIGFGLVAAQANKAADAFINFEDRLANLSSLTGLAGNDLAWLGEQAKILSVTTDENGIKITKSATDIIDAFTIMGSKKPELLQNKEALAEVTKQALILAEAAKMETQPAVESLAIVMNQFGADASQAGKFINVLAAGSKAGAAEIPSITDSITKFGAAAKAANISVEESVALVETLAEKGIEGEKAGTGLRAMLIKLQSGADDTNPKIVGLSRALENLAAKNLSAKEMTELFGLETYTVAQTVISSVGKFKDYTKAVTDTNVAIEQATINTQTNKAALAQAKNEAQLVAIAFGEKLTPALTAGTNAFAFLLKTGLAVINFLIEHKTLIISAIAGIAAYTVAVNAQTIATKAYEIATNFATRATQAFTNASKSSPWGLIAGLVAAATVAFAAFRREQDLTSKGFAEFNANLRKEQNEMNGLFDVIKSSAEGSKVRAEAIKTMNERYNQYLPHLLTEKDTLTEIEKIQKLANEALIKNIAIKSRQADIENVVTKTIEKQKDATTDLLDAITKKKGTAVAGAASLEIKELTDKIIALQNAGKNKEAWEERTRFISKYGLSINSAERNIRSIVDAQNLQTKSIKEIDTFYNSLIGTLDKTTGANDKLTKSTGGVDNKDKIKALEVETSKKEDALKKQLEDQEKYRQEVLLKSGSLIEAENKDYEERLKKAGVFDEAQRARLKDGQAVYEVLTQEHVDKLAKIRTDADNKVLEAQSEYFKATIANMADGLQKEELLENSRWEAEKLKLQEKLIIKQSLTDQEVQYNDLIKATIEQREQEHQDKLKAIRDVAALEKFEIGVLEAQNEEQAWNARRQLAQARYQQEFNDAHSNRLKELHAQKKYNDEIIAIETEKIDKLKEIRDRNLTNADTAIKILGTFVKKETALGKALFIASKAIAIAKIWVENAASNAAIYAKNLVLFSALGPGAPAAAAGWSAAAWAANNTSAALNTGLIAAEAIAEVAQKEKGKYNVTGKDDGVTYTNVPYIGPADTGLYTRPTLIAERGPELVVSAPHVRNLQMNYPAILNAIMATRVPQRADGNYPNNGMQPIPGNQTNDQLMQILAANTTIMAQLNDKLSRPFEGYIAIDRFEKDMSQRSSQLSDVTKS